MMLYVVVKNLSTNTQHTEKVIKGSVLWDVWSDHTANNGVQSGGVGDDEQIVEEHEHDESEGEEDDESENKENDEPEEEEDEEPEGWEDEEKNPWVDIWEEVKERHKEKLEAFITEFQKVGDSKEVAVEFY